MGEPVEPIYPFAPDSTIVRFELPRPLLAGRLDDGRDGLGRAALHRAAAPGARRAAASTSRSGIPRWWSTTATAGRSIRSIPPASSTASSARFTVDLDVPEDQVMGATGVPVCGDPGWERANRAPGRAGRVPARLLRRRARRRPTPATAPAPGRKRIRWYAERRAPLRHVAQSGVPLRGRPLRRRRGPRALPAGRRDDLGRRRRGRAHRDRARLARPALRPVRLAADHQRAPDRGRRHRVPDDDPRRLGRSGADRPRAGPQLHHGPPGQQRVARGLAGRGVHQLPDQLVLGDDGPAGELRRDRGARCWSSTSTTTPSRPASWREAYRDFTSYNIAIYTRGELFFHQLRYIVGDETMHRILQTFYERWKYQHVDEAAFRAVAEEVSQRDLSTFFAQWLHTTELYDYAVGRVHGAARRGDGRWVTRVEVVRKAPGRIPAGRGRDRRRATPRVARDRRARPSGSGWSSRPGPSRSRWCSIRWSGPTTGTCSTTGGGWACCCRSRSLPPPGDRRLLPPLLQHPRPGATGSPSALQPDGVVQRCRRRHARRPEPRATISGRFEQNVALRHREHRLGRGRRRPGRRTSSSGSGIRCCCGRPTCRRRSTSSTSRDATAPRATLERSPAGALTLRADLDPVGVTLQWVQPDDFRYLDPRLLRRRGHGRAAARAAASRPERASGSSALRSSVGGGLAYNRDGLAASGRTDLDPFYFRGSVEGTARRPLGAALGSRRARLYAGVARAATTARPSSGRSTSRARIRSSGWPIRFSARAARCWWARTCTTSSPGGGGVRGSRSAAVRPPRIVALNLELERSAGARGPRRGCSRGWRSPRSPTWRTASGRVSAPATGRPSAFSATRASASAPSIGSATRGSSPGSTCRCASAGPSWRRMRRRETTMSRSAGCSASSRRSEHRCRGCFANRFSLPRFPVSPVPPPYCPAMFKPEYARGGECLRCRTGWRSPGATS